MYHRTGRFLLFPLGAIKCLSWPATLAGGNVRVGLEDNLWLEKGVLATNAQLVEKAFYHQQSWPSSVAHKRCVMIEIGQNRKACNSARNSA